MAQMIGFKGGQILKDQTLDGTTTSAYTDQFAVKSAPTWAAHFEWTDDSTTLAITVTLWASCKANPSPDDDTDWVQMTSSHGYDGLPGGNPAGGSGKDLVDVSASGALWYRFKLARTAGSGTVNVWQCQKETR